jgi:aerobic-type carbon monoxide dehydrogenase small subunit (CoxS/CutS family)
MGAITVHVNGATHSLEVDSRMSLLDVALGGGGRCGAYVNIVAALGDVAAAAGRERPAPRAPARGRLAR